MNEIELKLRENRRKRMTEDQLREGYYLVSYNYDGDGLSDYRSTMLVKANSEEEALKKARDKKSDGRHFEIDRSQKEFPDGYVDSLETWNSKYPKSNYDITEAKEDSTYDLSKVKSKEQALTTITNLQPDKSASTDQWIAYSALIGDLMRKFNLTKEEVLRAHDLQETSDPEESIIRAKHTPMSTATKPQINEAFVESEAILQGLTKVRTEAREAYSKYVNVNDLAECKAILTYLVKDSKTLLDLVNDALAGKSVDESQMNEASWDDEEDFDEFEEEEYDDNDVVASNWKRLKDLQGDFWTNLDELVEDIEDKLGYEVVFKSREYLSVIDPDAEDDAEYKLTLGGTERTIVVELDSSYPM